MELEIQIEELRAELRNAVDAEERCQITAELDELTGELEAIVARQIADVESGPPE